MFELHQSVADALGRQALDGLRVRLKMMPPARGRHLLRGSGMSSTSGHYYIRQIGACPINNTAGSVHSSPRSQCCICAPRPMFVALVLRMSSTKKSSAVRPASRPGHHQVNATECLTGLACRRARGPAVFSCCCRGCSAAASGQGFEIDAEPAPMNAPNGRERQGATAPHGGERRSVA